MTLHVVEEDEEEEEEEKEKHMPASLCFEHVFLVFLCMKKERKSCYS